jgi:hypothetical protein
MTGTVVTTRWSAITCASSTWPCGSCLLDKARELREQIIGHLDDALPPDADDEEIAATLSLRWAARWPGCSGGGWRVRRRARERHPGHGRNSDRAAAERVRGRTWLIARQ